MPLPDRHIYARSSPPKQLSIIRSSRDTEEVERYERRRESGDLVVQQERVRANLAGFVIYESMRNRPVPRA